MFRAYHVVAGVCVGGVLADELAGLVPRHSLQDVGLRPGTNLVRTSVLLDLPKHMEIIETGEPKSHPLG